MKNIFMLMYEVSPFKGGITRVMMNRTFMFERLGCKPYIVTLDERGDSKYLEKLFKSQGRISPNSEIINFLEYFKTKNTKYKINISDTEHDVFEDGLFIQDQYFLTKGFIRYFNKLGVLIKRKVWKDKKLRLVEYYDNNIITYIKYFNDDGSLFKIVDYKNNEECQTRYFTKDNFCFFQRSLLNNIPHYFLFDRDTRDVIGFNSSHKLHVYFLETLCSGSERTKNIIICDGQGSSSKVVAIDNKLAIRFLTLHSNHYKKPYVKGAELTSEATQILHNTSKADGLIVLTHRQKTDIVDLMPEIEEKVFVIPNTSSIKNNVIKDYNKPKKIINVVSRYVPNKQLDHMIHAVYKLINQKNISEKNIELNFFGAGSSKKGLENLVQSLNLSTVVKIHEYATDVDSILLDADITLLTSLYEGFSMALFEAMINKTPVISYDINYGPSDIIDDGNDGFLVSANNIDELSRKIYEVLFVQYDKLPDIGVSAYNKIINHFTHEVAEKLWKNLIS